MKRRVIYPARRRTGTYRSRAKETLVYMRKHWMFYAMLALPILYYVLFHYKAMPGVVIAFKNYNIFKGIWESPWVGGAVKGVLVVSKKYVGAEYYGTGAWFPAPDYSGFVFK